MPDESVAKAEFKRPPKLLLPREVDSRLCRVAQAGMPHTVR